MKELISTQHGNEPHIQAVATVLFQPAGWAMPELVTKRWGHELIYYNERYCLKNIMVNKGKKTSMHYHIDKHETILVGAGTLTIRYIANGEEHQKVATPGTAIVIPPGFAHQFIAEEEDVLLTEASSHDIKEDSVRVHL